MLAAIKEFGGAVTWAYFFSDGAKELKKAAIDLGSTVHFSSTPYRPSPTASSKGEWASSVTVYAVYWANPVSRTGGGRMLRQLGPGLNHSHDLGHLLPVHPVLEHHCGHAVAVSNGSLDRSFGRPDIIDQYLSRR